MDDNLKNMFTFQIINKLLSKYKFLVFYLLQGLLATTVLFLKRRQLADILTKMYRQFWRTDTVKLSVKEELFFRSTYRRLKWISNTFYILGVILTFAFFVAPVLWEKETLPLKCYRPSFVSFEALFVVEVISMVFGTLLPAVSLQILIMTLAKLTELQFRLLNKHIEATLSLHFQEDLLTRVKSIVDHHNFLME